MGIRDMFDHKYPITNLHEVDLTFMHDDIDKMISILESWESIIEELRKGLDDLNGINSRVVALESLTSGLNQAYLDIAALKNQTRVNTSAIDAIRLELDNLVDSWDEFISNFTYYVDAKVEIEKRARIKGDYDLDVKIEALRIQIYDDIEILYQLIQQLNPVDVYNPGCGRRLDLDKNTRITYIQLRDKGITIGQLLQRHITVGDIAEKYRCWILACKGLDIFKYTRHMYSPITGRLESYHQIDSNLIGLIKNSSTIGDVISANLTISDLIALDKTCGELLLYQF